MHVDNFWFLQVEIDFKSECRMDDQVEPVVYRVDAQENGSSKNPIFVHVLQNQSEAETQEIVRMRTKWELEQGSSNGCWQIHKLNNEHEN